MSAAHSNLGATVGANELFALTDEQIVGLGPEQMPSDELPPTGQEQIGERDLQALGASQGDAAATPHRKQARSQESAEAPQWLAERMRDPWHGEAAKELWDGKQRAEAEIAAYREVFATAAEARALKEIYPGGVEEAKTTADRARQLDAMDAAFYRGDAATRAQLAQHMMQQDPAAFRAMVEAGLKLLENTSQSHQPPGTPANVSAQQSNAAQAEPAPAPELVRAYGEFEKAANAELEKSVGGAIARVLEGALPNLRAMAGGQEAVQHGTPLQDRLATAVREEVESALRSDRDLSEQVSRVLTGRRFDEPARRQVVRLIDGRAQQLVPGAVKRVVDSWTRATLAARTKTETTRAPEPITTAPRVSSREEKPVRRRESAPAWREPATRTKRVDYARLSDEDILRL